MRRRSRAGGEPIKTRRRKAAPLKRGSVPKDARRRGSAAAGLNKNVAPLDTRARRGPGAADGYSGNFACHQLVARRLAAGFRSDLGERNAHLRGHLRRDVAPRGRWLPQHCVPRCAARGLHRPMAERDGDPARPGRPPGPRCPIPKAGPCCRPPKRPGLSRWPCIDGYCGRRRRHPDGRLCARES